MASADKNTTDKLAAKSDDKSNAENFKQPKTLAELLALPLDQLDKVDIALINLLCAEGLRGAEDLDVPQLLKTLDSWTEWIRINTKRHRYRFERDPKYFKNLEGDFRMAILSATLQQQYGVLYNPARAEPQLRDGPYAESDEVFFADSKDIFIHGLLSGKHYGTCSSMPILFVAIAQRLGYPVHLAVSKGHFIVRYDEGIRHFNVEATSPGYAVHGDDYYKDGMFAVTDEEAQSQHYFQPMNGRQLLAACLDSRSACLNAAGEFKKSREVALAAHKLAPYMKEYKVQAEHLAERIENKRKAEKWDKLVAEIVKIVPPEGDKFDYFRDKKIDLQIYLFQTADVDGTEKGLTVLKQELAKENPVDAPARISLSLNPQPHVPVQIIVLPEKARYVTLDGQTIETLVKSPEQLAEFFIEQRVLDKVAERERLLREMSGMSGQSVLRPDSVQFKVPPGKTRQEGLQILEARLDRTLAALAELKDEAPPNPQALMGLPPELQNTMNRGMPNLPNLPLPISPQLENLERLQKMLSPTRKASP